MALRKLDVRGAKCPIPIVKAKKELDTMTAGDQLEVTGKATIGPLVKRFLAGIRRGASPSPSFEDGMRAQAVLDAVRESLAAGRWAAVPAPAPL